MYGRPETAEAEGRLWADLRARLRAAGLDVPDRLERPTDLFAHWRAPDLAMAQTCGMQIATALREQVTYVATPDFGLPGCARGSYMSVIIARAGTGDPADIAGRRLAYNDAFSQSGYAAALDWAAAQGARPAAFVHTGAHLASVAAVRDGRADWAAIDAQTWALARRHAPEDVASLAEIARTPQTPAPPFITAKGQDPAPVADALASAITALAPEDRDALGLYGVVQLPLAAYDVYRLPPSPEALAAE